MKLHPRAAAAWLWEERMRLVKYLISGISAVAIDGGVYFVCTRALHLNEYASNLLSVMAGGLVSFTINKFWSFQRRGNTLRQSRRFIALFVFNYFFQQWGFYVALNWLHAYDLLAKFVLIAIMVCWNFLLYKYWVYAVDEHQA